MNKKTKRFLIFILCISLISIFFGCNNEQLIPENGDEKPVVEPIVDGEPDVETDNLSELAVYLSKNLPRMDGSTSLIPLEGGIRAVIFGITQTEGEKQTIHSTTYGAFSNLLEGKCDLIFSTPLSEVQDTQAKEKGLELELTPISMEGFVFVVNAKNPINKLTQQQLKDIYSGKITNWKELGGNDAEIVAYQRNSTSGSQNYMIEFMGDTQLMKPVTDKIPGTMSGLMDAIAIYENSENAIGYSVYAYAADMYGNGNEIKFIEVDSVAPTKKTMANGSYPLLNYNYAICDKKLDESSPAKKLVKWLLTDEGQQAIANAGYITVSNAMVKETSPSLYTALGTGYEKSEDYKAPSHSYRAVDIIEITMPSEFENYDVENDPPLKGITYKLKGLKNQELTTKVNEFITTAVAQLEKGQEDKLKFIENKGPYYSAGWVKFFSKNEFSDTFNYIPAIQVDVNCLNGYLSVVVYSEYRLEAQDGYSYYYDCRTAVYDIYNGNKLSLSDLFYKGTDFVSALNEGLKKDAGMPIDSWGILFETKRDFVGLLPDFDTFTAESALFSAIDANNIYFIDGAKIDFRETEGLRCVELPRDMADLWTDDIQIAHCFITKNSTAGFSKDNYSVLLLEPNGQNDEIREKINNEMLEYIEKSVSPDEIAKIAAKLNNDFESFGYHNIDWKVTEIGSKYAFFSCWSEIFIKLKKGYWIDDFHQTEDSINYRNTIIYDLKTGEKVDWTTLFNDGWKEACSYQTVIKSDKTEPGLSEETIKRLAEGITPDDLIFSYIEGYGDYYISSKTGYTIYRIGDDVFLTFICDKPNIKWVYMTIPKQYIKWD